MVGLLIAALVAGIFFDDPHLYFYKRVIYVTFLYFVIYQLFLFNYSKKNRFQHVTMPAFYKPYIRIFLAFILFELIIDFFNPAFSIVTLLNHPLALMAVVPIFAFKVGYQTTDAEKIYKLLYGISFFFLLFLVVPIKGNNIYNAAISCYVAVLPFLAFSIVKKKHLLYAIILLGLGFLLSEVSDSRTILLRIVLFIGLFFSLSFVKKYTSLKFLTLLLVGFFIYEVLTDLQNFIDIFVSDTGAKKFDDSDTRTFLYEEFFGDVKTHELIFGRGFLGHYFSPYFLDQMQQGISDGDSFNRFSIEVGFLQLLLKGGFVYYILYILPLVATCYTCLFGRGSDRLSFILAIVILTELFIMFIENIPAFTFQFFLMYFLAGFAYRRNLASLIKPAPAKGIDVNHFLLKTI